MKTVVMSRKQVEWAGNAVAVAGGWIATCQPRVQPQFVPDSTGNDGVEIPGGMLALVPDSWDTFVRPISVEDARALLADAAKYECDEEIVTDAVAKLASI
jgi:hypothetical protein